MGTGRIRGSVLHSCRPPPPARLPTHCHYQQCPDGHSSLICAIGAQLGPKPLCLAVMGRPQLERSCRHDPRALRTEEMGKQTGSSSKGNLSANECLQLGWPVPRTAAPAASLVCYSFSRPGVLSVSWSLEPYGVYCGIRVVPHIDVGDVASPGTSWPVAMVSSALKQNC